MPTPFLEQRFPPEISYGSSGGPAFNTSVFVASSGFEQRNINWEYARCKYDVSHGIKTHEQMAEVLDFFYVVKGKATGFRYKDWADYQLDMEQIGVGDGVTTAYQITKTYTVGAESYVRTLRKIVQPFTPPAPPTPGYNDPAVVFEVYVNDVLQTITTHYTIDYNTGIITFTSPPANTHTIKVNGEFDVPVRFDTDEMQITLESFDLETWDSIPLVEIKTLA